MSPIFPIVPYIPKERVPVAEIAFVVLIVLYALAAAKVDEWITISALGFKMETPLLFLQKPKLYDIARSLLFLGALVTSFGMTAIHWYTGLGILAIVWLAAGWVGRKKAFNNYRHILHEMIASADTPEEKSQYGVASKKTDQELMDMAIKYGL